MSNQELKIEIIKAKNNINTIKINGYLLHSKYDPIREAEKFANINYKPGCVHVVFGYGLGYYLQELKKMFNNNEQLICVEPITEINTNENHFDVLIRGYDEANIKQMLKVLLTKDINVNFLCSPNYDKLFPKQYKNFIEILKNRIELNKIDENTIYKFSKDWMGNYLNNISKSFLDEDISLLQQKYREPIVVASGGPSLTKQIPLLREHREKYILIAAGSTINTLMNYELEPDFVVSIDGGINNYNHFKKKKLSRTRLIYSLFNHYRIRESFENQCYYFLSQDLYNLEPHLKKFLSVAPTTLLGGGSVATYALSFGRYISSGPIAIVGQDLAYTDNKSHAEFNNNFEIIKEISTGKFMVDGYNGEKVLTDLAFFSMKETFEILIQQLKDNDEIFNCTEGGVLINGLRNMEFNNFCTNYFKTKTKTVINNNLYTSNSITRKKEEIKLTLLEDLENYEVLIKLIIDNLTKLKEAKRIKEFTFLINEGMKENERKLNNIIKKLPISIILEGISLRTVKYFNEVKDEKVEDSFERVYMQNEFFFTNLKNDVKDCMSITKNIINNL